MLSDTDTATVTVVLSPAELLAQTGVSLGMLVAIALAMLTLGVLALWLSRRRPDLL